MFLISFCELICGFEFFGLCVVCIKWFSCVEFCMIEIIGVDCYIIIIGFFVFGVFGYEIDYVIKVVYVVK